MFLFFLEKSNLLLGDVPEPLGLFLFGGVLISLTVILRWFLSEDDSPEPIKRKIRDLTRKN